MLRPSLVSVLLVLGLPVLAACHDDPIRPSTGFLVVSVKDVSGPAVAGVEVRVAPLGQAIVTDTEGVAMFQAAPGEYFVDAEICCRGAGMIDYHIPVTLVAGATETVQLQACLFCE